MSYSERDLRAHFPQRLNAFGRPIKRRTFGAPVTTNPDARCHCGELVADTILGREAPLLHLFDPARLLG